MGTSVTAMSSEQRKIATDGNAYTWDEFVIYYPDGTQWYWDQAGWPEIGASSPLRPQAAPAPLAALAPVAIYRGLKRRLSDNAIDGRERVLQKVGKAIEGTVGKLKPGTANGLSLCRQLSDEFSVILDSVIDQQLEGADRDVESFQQRLGDETLGAIQTTNVSANPEIEALLDDDEFSGVLLETFLETLMSEEVFSDLQEVLQI